MKTYPLQSISIEQAKQKQFRMVDCIMKHFDATESLTRGDLGLIPGLNEPRITKKAQAAIADFFNAEACILVTGSGTGAIRFALMANLKSGQKILLHKAPVYPTTLTTIESMGLQPVFADYNNLDEVRAAVEDVDGVLIQYTRQKPDDSYNMADVIDCCKGKPIVTDDNYAVMKVDKIGCELGATASAFSAFKLQGPEGVGIVVGDNNTVENISKMNYSGGSKVQGWQAMEVLRGLVYSPVLLAIQAEENEKAVKLAQDLPHVKDAFLANAQSKVLLIEFDEPIAKDVLKRAHAMGCLENPVGAESKYEIAPMFYKVSGTFLKHDPTYIDTMIRINPNRASADTIIYVLKMCLKCI